jgi:hypothetical protein
MQRRSTMPNAVSSSDADSAAPAIKQEISDLSKVACGVSGAVKITALMLWSLKDANF